MNKNTRIGIGYDAHPLVKGRKLVLGGVAIPFSKGLEGWSDADVLTHAVMDALLGAAALGDIGVYFPSGQKEYKDISSLVLLDRVASRLEDEEYRVGNIDVTVLAEKPQLAGHIDAMRKNISRVLNIEKNRVSIKASSNNDLGFAGRGEGIAAYAVALIESGDDEDI